MLAGEGKATKVQHAEILKEEGNTVQSLTEVLLKPPAAAPTPQLWSWTDIHESPVSHYLSSSGDRDPGTF